MRRLLGLPPRAGSPAAEDGEQAAPTTGLGSERYPSAGKRERREMYLAAALDGFGSHPAARHLTGAQHADLFDPTRVVALARLAEQGLLDFVTLDDQQSGPPERGCPHRALDSWLAFGATSALTDHIGLIPTGVARGEPADMAAKAASFDRIAAGRGGWRPRVALTDDQRRRATADPERYAAFTEERFEHVTEFVGAVTGFWDSWRESSSIGADGPPLIAVLAHFAAPFRLAARYADVVFVTPFDREDVLAIRAELDRWCDEAGRAPVPLTVLADLDVVLAPTESEADERRSALDRRIHPESDAATFSGTPEGLADLLEEWHRDGGVDGFRIRPAVLPDDLTRVVTGLIPLLQGRGLYKTSYGEPLRTRLRSGPM